MISKEANIQRVVFVRINPGDDVLAGINQAAAKHNLKNAIILMGFGSVRKSNFHVVMSNELPPAESYPKSEQPLDVCSIGGLIIGGKVHGHITFSDERNGFGGHLEEGCLALTFVVIGLGDLGDTSLSDWDTFKDESDLD